MRFRLRYITKDFYFGDAEIKVSDPDRGIEVVYRRLRTDDGEMPRVEFTDGLIVATCERSLSERLQNEAVNSGVLSLKKEAVCNVYDDMYDSIERTLRLTRWRTNARGGPNPIRVAMQSYFAWSTEGSTWNMVADCVSAKFEIEQIDRPWTGEDAAFLQTEILKGTNEPLGHELWREASANRKSNPRSSLILAVAAAEIGFKQFVSKRIPDAAWLMGLPSPPLVEMLNKFPWGQVKLRINDKVPAVPESIVGELKKAVNLRNKIVHSGVANLTFETLDSILTTVHDFLYFRDMLHETGHEWPAKFISPEVIDHFKKD